MKAYSTDLRQKIIETYENDLISQRQLAQRFLRRKVGRGGAGKSLTYVS